MESDSDSVKLDLGWAEKPPKRKSSYWSLFKKALILSFFIALFSFVVVSYVSLSTKLDNYVSSAKIFRKEIFYKAVILLLLSFYPPLFIPGGGFVNLSRSQTEVLLLDG